MREIEDAEYEASTSIPRTRLARRHRFDSVNETYDKLLAQRQRDQDQRDESSRMWLVGALLVAISLALILIALAVSG